MLKAAGLALALALASTAAYAEDDDNDTIPRRSRGSKRSSPSLVARATKRSRRRIRASTRSTTPNARWARSISSSTRL